MNPASVKLAAIFLWGAFGAFLLASAAGLRPWKMRIPRALPIAGAGVAVTLLFLRFAANGTLFPTAVVTAGIIFAIRERAERSLPMILSALAVVTSAVSLAWWLDGGPQPHFFWRTILFATVACFVHSGLLSAGGITLRGDLALWIAFAIGGAILLSNTAPYAEGEAATSVLAHHQGAYIGSALHLRAGLVPFYDVPLQYGLGPTLAIAAACEVSGCRHGMQFLAITSTLTMGLLFLGMALTTTILRGLRWKCAAALAIFIAVFVWPGFPDLGVIPTATPSVGGMRFLPVTAVAFLLFFGNPQWAALALAPALLWSPEVGCMALVVYIVHETARLSFARAARNTAAIVSSTIAVLVIGHRLFYGVWMQPEVVVEYVLHVPGPLPVNLFSDALFLMAALGLAGWMVWRRAADPIEFRRNLLAATMLFAVISYYLGRSHPNNVCNLMPFAAFVALRALDGDSPAAWPALPRLASIGVATAVAAVAFSTWRYSPLDWRLGPVAAQADTDFNAIRASIPNPDHLGVAEFGASLNRNPAETIVWTPMDPPSLWTFVPADRRQLYIRRSAARLHRPGWAIFADDQADLLSDFRVAYRIAEQTSYELPSRIPGKPSKYIAALLIPIGDPGHDAAYFPSTENANRTLPGAPPRLP